MVVQKMSQWNMALFFRLPPFPLRVFSVTSACSLLDAVPGLEEPVAYFAFILVTSPDLAHAFCPALGVSPEPFAPN